MMTLRSWMPLAIGAYVLAAMVSLYLAFTGGGSGESAIWLAILGMPWTIVAVVVSDLAGPQVLDEAGIWVGVGSVIANTGILTWVARRWARRIISRPDPADRYR